MNQVSLKVLLQRKIATFVSYILIPPVPAAIAFALFTWNFQHMKQMLVGVVAVLFGGVIPLIVIGYLRSREKITAYDAPIREQRTTPYLVSVGIYLFGLVVLYLLGTSFFIQGLMWCYAANTFILALVNKFWKVSAHTMGIAGPMTALILVFGKYILPFFLLIVLVGWARVVLKSHTIPQVIVGGLMGMVLTAGQFVLLFWVTNILG